MKVKIKILICTGLMLNDHSNPYIESTTVLSDSTLLIGFVYLYIYFCHNKKKIIRLMRMRTAN